MTVNLKPYSWLLTAGLAAILLLSGPVTHNATAQDLFVQVSDTVAASGQQDAVIPVFIINFNDTVAGFNVWLQLDRPDIMVFKTDTGTSIDTSYWDCLTYDTTNCIDSVLTNPSGPWDFIHIDTSQILIGSFDTTGTLCSGWELVDARSIGGIGTDLNIVALADMPSLPVTTGIPPRQQKELLIKVLADVISIPDTMTDRTVNILVQHDFIDHFNFSRPDGSSIGVIGQEVLDTNYFVCEIWAGQTCLQWTQVSLPPADSTEIIIDTIAVIDTANVIVDDGSLTVLSFMCGDMQGDLSTDIVDLTYLIDFLFAGGPPPNPFAAGNVDCDIGGGVDIVDLTYYVDFLFSGGPDPCMGPGC
ncbi:MAG: hypothetical protein ACE5FH_01300 [Candidatus Zixiibacteriota bacterium]